MMSYDFSGKNIWNPWLFDWYAGFWGFLGMSLCLVIFYFIPVESPLWAYSPTPPYQLEDSIDGFIQLGNNPLLLVAIFGLIFSIAFFNYAGQTVTKELSATTRMVLDSVRTLVIWLFSICIGWQKFQYLQVRTNSIEYYIYLNTFLLVTFISFFILMK